ncbi:MAG TPA: hypothetical protein VFU94_15305 [Conexibacter sp.]|nr:hypothetical protein [Conexibacter sp.]
MQHRARAIVALLVLAVAAVALAACGGSSSGGGNAQTLLRQTFSGSHQIRSGKASVHVRVVATGDPSLQGPIEATISGPFQSVGSHKLPKFDLAIDASAEGQSIKAGLTSTSDQLFVSFGGTAYAAPAQLVRQLEQSYRRSQRRGASGQHTSLHALGLDPLGWLQDPTVVGTESVGGTQTDHISAKVSVSALLADVDKLLARASAGGIPGVPSSRVPSSLPANVRSQIEQAVKSATFDVWSGKSDHTLRRLALALNVVPPRGTPRSVTVDLSVELTDLNQPQTIAAPTATRPLSELLGQFQGLLGGALGGSGGSGSSSSGGANSAQLDAYARCVQRAGSNVAEAQKCASLLTK